MNRGDRSKRIAFPPGWCDTGQTLTTGDGVALTGSDISLPPWSGAVVRGTLAGSTGDLVG